MSLDDNYGEHCSNGLCHTCQWALRSLTRWNGGDVSAFTDIKHDTCSSWNAARLEKSFN